MQNNSEKPYEFKNYKYVNNVLLLLLYFGVRCNVIINVQYMKYIIISILKGR